MNDAVHTIFGMIPRHLLDVTEKIEEDPRTRVVKTIWTLRETIEVEHDGGLHLITYTYPPQQAPDGAPIQGTERVVTSIKGEVARVDCHVMAKRGVEALPGQGFLNS